MLFNNIDKKTAVFLVTRIPFKNGKETTQMSTSNCIAELPYSFFTEPQSKDFVIGVQSDSILIVDNNVNERKFMRQGLEAHGYSCQEAENGLAALRQIKFHSFDVVLTNLTMPFLDGLGLAQHLQEDSSLGNPRVILMTSSRTDMITHLACTFGIEEVLERPCLPSDVDRILHPEQIKFPWAA